MAIENLEDLFVQELCDIYSAEKQLTKALPKMAKAAADPSLTEAFEDHLQETEGQVTRLERIMQLCDIKKKRRKCEAMKGLIEEGNEIIKDIEEGMVRDTGLISAAQKVEHYEISAYLSLIKLAEQLGFREAIPLLSQTLEEEENADDKLADIGESDLQGYDQGRSWRYRETGGQWANR